MPLVVLVLLAVLLAHLVSNLYLLLALLGQRLVAKRAANDFLSFTHDLVLPGSRAFDWLLVTITHEREASRDQPPTGSPELSQSKLPAELSSRPTSASVSVRLTP